MLNDLTGVPGLWKKTEKTDIQNWESEMAEKLLSNSFPPGVSAKGLFSLVQCVSQIASPDNTGNYSSGWKIFNI